MAKFTERPITSVDEVGGFFRTGKVEGANTWSETHFSSTTTSGGGGGYLHQGSGYISSPTSSTTVSSRATEVTRFFLDYGKDAEEEFKLKGGNFATRDGHMVSVIRIGPKGEKWGYNLAFYNHSTSTVYADESWLGHPLDQKPTKTFLFLAPIGGLLAGIGTDGTLALVLAVIALGIAIYFFSKKSGEYRRLIAAVRVRRDEEIEAAKAAYATRQAKDDGTLVEINKELRA